MRRLYTVLLVSLASAATVAACGSTTDVPADDDPFAPDGAPQPSPDPSPFFPSEGGVDPTTQPFAIVPADAVLVVENGAATSTVQYTARTETGALVPVSFTIDRGEIGNVGLSSGLFTATGNVGGRATVTASYKGRTASTSVTVKLKITQNGADTPGDAGVGDGGDAGGGTGSGGNGGVGGSGPGGAVTTAQMATLRGGTTTDPTLKLLYPYDKTVWPRGVLAPLLQWSPGAEADYDAIYIKLEEAAFSYEGFFTKPAAPFANHPIPQLAWKQLLASNAGEDATITVVLAKGATAYGPMRATWKIASAPLKGTVYYNSYGTNLARNFNGALPDNRAFGGATLAIRGSSTDPVLVSGSNDFESGCRVCHSVAGNGSVLLTQRDHGDQRKFSAYDLKATPQPAETVITNEGATASYAWPAIYPDGTMFVGDSSSAMGSTSAVNRLFSMPTGPTGNPVAIDAGWPTGLRGALPSFSHDGKNLAFTIFGGVPGADRRSLGLLPFDAATKTFGALRTVHTPAMAQHSALYPSFLPTNDGLIFELEIRYNGRDFGETRADADVAPPNPLADQGTRAELWWLDLRTDPPTARRLDRLNGLEAGSRYLPVAGSGHDRDDELNYEPTVNPVPSGGYAWVVFTSRRLYGNVATINPFYSDPRYHDLTTTPTPKKLWVAAIDLNAPAGTDPSHPAFYLPAQELLAGNSRGYWVVDPCKNDNASCETGDECCGGFCRPGPTGALVCTATTPTCAQEFESCAKSSDCCNAAAFQCINGRCAAPSPK